MERLCERPGCSESAAVAYGMRTEDLVFWIDVLRDSTVSAGGVLCQRHGDSMVVPRGWTLDDLRDPELHLFRPPRPERPTRRRKRRRHTSADDDSAQLELGGMLPPEPSASVPGRAESEPEIASAAQDPAVANDRPAEDALAGVDSDEQWTPTFDAADDLDGLLSARSPLLSRAFRGTDRPG